MAGPLQGLKVIEMGGMGPAPFCAMMFADAGAEIVRIERPGGAARIDRFDVTARGREVLELDLRQPENAQVVLRMLESADVLVEGFRPGVMERLGLGPDVCLARRPQLVYGRMTGWGQTGPLAQAAGHDIDYIALSGALHAIGDTGGPPVVPLNLVGDFGGGGMLLAFGVLAAVLEARSSGKGQVVDAAMTEGSALLSAMIYGFRASGNWSNRRGDNLLDGGAHFYGTYQCADGKYLAVGAIEPQFYAELMQRCGIDDPALRERQWERAMWPELKSRLAAIFRAKTRDQWCQLLDGTDACAAPVLDWDEAPQHPHNVAREAFFTRDGITQPSPAPKFSRTPGATPQVRQRDAAEILRAWGAG
ncbi:CaiB/BaiF CoA transferase family protein [Lacisediminimonas profundi]|uniref:CaiB/BaiF CoA transferase family protein n=1 Tax=Lacisediminimonas profundi TaxID=2603856 RepID=UPI00124B5D8B|nr:CaiB/BaiF CoA-transferase family protein [Lacisediminimonas profundi]